MNQTPGTHDPGFFNFDAGRHYCENQQAKTREAFQGTS